MKANRIAEFGSPQTRQSTILPESLNTSASCASVTCQSDYRDQRDTLIDFAEKAHCIEQDLPAGLHHICR
jgi:hypothetical protein